MFSLDREYHFEGILKLSKSHVIATGLNPKDDIINWLFVKIDKSLFTIIYKIEDPLAAEYETPFKVQVSFAAIEHLQNTLSLNNTYEVLRGQESVGSLVLNSVINNF